MNIVYVLKSLHDGKLYIGSTRKTGVARLKVHNSGSVRSTKGRRPFELIYTERFGSYTDARKRENYFKTSIGRAELKRLMLFNKKLDV
ncbi:MAG: GIY-YIG nuclease family protein [Candidatus Omnitrophica bacterium]|nr:GIY-YIG nuclease family protein [Candidatus Omnitrophota bacterium]